MAEDRKILGTIHLKDIIKGGMRERFDQLRAMGIRTVMITGDNPLTAAAIAREAGLDDFLAQAKPEDKLALIRAEQAKGKLVAMTGDGTNDAPALAQADVGLAMNAGTQAAKEAGNMVDLDSNPTKLIEVVEIGKQLADHPRRAHDIFGGERRGQIFRHHPGDVCRRVPAAQRAQHHGAEDAAIGDSVRGDFQRADHHRACSAGAARRALSSAGRFGVVALELARLRRGRHHCAVYRNQAHRPDHHPHRLGVRTHMKKNLMISIWFTLVTTVLLGIGYPLVVTGLAQLMFPEAGQWANSSPRMASWSARTSSASPSPRPDISIRGLRRQGAAGYDPTASGGSNLGPTNKMLIDRVDASVKSLQPTNPNAPIPADLVTTSASGLDPRHLSRRGGVSDSARGPVNAA